uniref:Expressed conserved protein n=1 Tax=Echinococcus granulosus TaxID=6210 RepID=A0A068X2P3_ECHGR|nr:hypothetical protein EgrG_002057600 [Echinococcus granulosus]
MEAKKNGCEIEKKNGEGLVNVNVKKAVEVELEARAEVGVEAEAKERKTKMKRRKGRGVKSHLRLSQIHACVPKKPEPLW